MTSLIFRSDGESKIFIPNCFALTNIGRRTRGGRDYDEDIIYERSTEERRSRDMEVTQMRGRSLSAPKRRFTAPADNEFGLEADYYNRKALERAYPGEALNGATKDWAIVDVPPGTNRVRMDGAGGGAQEISWQRYNGVRRSKFLSGDEEISTDFGMPAAGPPKAKAKDMWTEITKDLVLREAIDSMGYDCEETDDFFYVMEYLRYVCSFPTIFEFKCDANYVTGGRAAPGRDFRRNPPKAQVSRPAD